MVTPRVYSGKYTWLILTELNLNMQARDLERMWCQGDELPDGPILHAQGLGAGHSLLQPQAGAGQQQVEQVEQVEQVGQVEVWRGM